MTILQLEDFQFVRAPLVRGDPRWRKAYFNLHALLEEEPDIAARVAELEQSPAYDPAYDRQDPTMPQYVTIERDRRLVGIVDLECDRDSRIFINTDIHPSLRGRGYGSVQLALGIVEAGRLGYQTLEARIHTKAKPDADPTNQASWQQYERLQVEGLARRLPDEVFREQPVRAYRVSTQYPAEAYWRALMKKPAP